MSGTELLARVVAAVVRQAVTDARAAGVVVLEPESPEGRLVVGWCEEALGAEHVWRATRDAALEVGVEVPRDARQESAEWLRHAALLYAARHRGLCLHPANKTALLLAQRPPPEPLLPLGDLYASRVVALTGSWNGPPEVVALAERAGGVEQLDRALGELLERRLDAEAATAHLPPSVRADLIAALETGRFHRRRLGLVPKLGARTPGIDLFA